MPRISIWAVAALTSLALLSPAEAQHADHGDRAGAEASSLPTEAGSDAFAAIAEIVAILSADPATDWARVDIEALRRHLVDMDAVMGGASVEATTLPRGLRMRVSLTGPAGGAASRMVPAHGPVLAAETDWSSTVASLGDHLIWTVEGPTRADGARIRALGFAGLMAVGDHHRAHHLALARGEPH